MSVHTTFAVHMAMIALGLVFMLLAYKQGVKLMSASSDNYRRIFFTRFVPLFAVGAGLIGYFEWTTL